MSLTQITNNYNPLGKMGPLYERPEYRPPEKNDAQEAEAGLRNKSDRSTLSVKNPDGKKLEAAPILPIGKLNLSTAQDLLGQTADLIQQLSPFSTKTPHLYLPKNLMQPVYV